MSERSLEPVYASAFFVTALLRLVFDTAALRQISPHYQTANCFARWHCSVYFSEMEIVIPMPLADRLSREDVALQLAIGLFVTEEATLGQAAQVAGVSQPAFLQELGQRQIPIHYGVEELAADLQAVESLVTR
jgi:predicted HTH domain antitoxin